MAAISAKVVKELREKTGAGMMDCKKALTENDGDMEKSIEWLRQKGTISADKKQGRVAAEGLVESYIHTGGRIGVLVEVNCETDFVARREEFQELVKNIAMQIAACPNVEFVRVDDIPQDTVTKEKEIEMGRDDLDGKPDNIKEKIVTGRIDKRFERNFFAASTIYSRPKHYRRRIGQAKHRSARRKHSNTPFCPLCLG